MKRILIKLAIVVGIVLGAFGTSKAHALGYGGYGPECMPQSYGASCGGGGGN